MKTLKIAFKLSLLIISTLAFAQNGGPDFKSPCGMTSASFKYPPEPTDAEGQKIGYYNLDFYLTIEKEAPTYYWAHQYWFVGGDAAYMGLQTVTNNNCENTKIALFSIWNAKNAASAPDGTSSSFGHEGSGWSCRINYNWQEGRMYQLRVWDLGAVSDADNDHWWGAWVTDIATEQTEFIGKILVPSKFKGLSSDSVDFVEFYGNQDRQRHPCSDIQYTKTTYKYPTLNNGTVKPINVVYSAYGECKSVARIRATGPESYQSETGL